jgi:hypothetical protein
LNLFLLVSCCWKLFKGVVGVNKARVEEYCFFVLESWEKTIMKKYNALIGRSEQHDVQEPTHARIIMLLFFSLPVHRNYIE